MEQALQEKLLASFPNSRSLGVICAYGTGHSGSPVLAVHYEKKNKYGLHGTFIVKIGEEKWALKEQEFYDTLPSSASSPLLTQGHMHTPSLNGKSAVAYEVAFNALIRPKTLMNILDEENKSEKEAQTQVKALASSLVDWYLKGNCVGQSIVRAAHTLVCDMLTEKRVQDLPSRLQESLSFWKPGTAHITVDGLDRRLPNPLTYKEICEKVPYNLICPRSLIHGDLHTGNVICFPEAEEVPKLIDFDQSTFDGVPFFDLAYLEFDIIRHLLLVEQPKQRQNWLDLLNCSMTDILGGKAPSSWMAARAWAFIELIRQEVLRLQQMGEQEQGEGGHYEAVWWLATVAAGLNFARKGDQSRSHFERMAGLLYAAYGLDRILKMFEIKELPAKESALFVPWIQGDSRPSTLALTLENAPDLSISARASSAAVTPSADSSEVVPPQASQLLPSEPEQSLGLQPTPEIGAGNIHIPSIEIASSIPDQVDVKTTSEDKHPAIPPTIAADKMQQLLQHAVDTFRAGRLIYKDMCLVTDETLRLLETFLQERSQNTDVYDFYHRFSQDNLLTLQKSLRSDLRNFGESCLPAPTRKLDQSHYDEEYAAISNKLEKLQEKFLALLRTLS